MTEDQVVVCNEVEKPDIQLLCIVTLRIRRNRQNMTHNMYLLRIDAFNRLSLSRQTLDVFYRKHLQFFDHL